MRKINYRLIVSDFDGTLLRSDGTISEKTRRAISDYVTAGGAFAVCTGRMTSSIVPRARDLGLKGAAASYQGSVISDIESGRLLVDGSIGISEGAAVCRVFEQLGLHIHVYTLDRFYVNADDVDLARYEKVCGVKGTVVSDRLLSDLIEEKRLNVRKVLAIVRAEEKLSVYEKIRERLNGEFYVTYSAAELVEVTSARYSKGTAVRFLADFYHVPIGSTLAVGDSLNDLPMLETAGMGIAVRNADDALKNKAVAFPYSNDEDAIAEIIARYGFVGEEI